MRKSRAGRCGKIQNFLIWKIKERPGYRYYNFEKDGEILFGHDLCKVLKGIYVLKSGFYNFGYGCYAITYINIFPICSIVFIIFQYCSSVLYVINWDGIWNSARRRKWNEYMARMPSKLLRCIVQAMVSYFHFCQFRFFFKSQKYHAWNKYNLSIVLRM